MLLSVSPGFSNWNDLTHQLYNTKDLKKCGSIDVLFFPGIGQKPILMQREWAPVTIFQMKFLWPFEGSPVSSDNNSFSIPFQHAFSSSSMVEWSLPSFLSVFLLLNCRLLKLVSAISSISWLMTFCFIHCFLIMLSYHHGKPTPNWFQRFVCSF